MSLWVVAQQNFSDIMSISGYLNFWSQIQITRNAYDVTEILLCDIMSHEHFRLFEFEAKFKQPEMLTEILLCNDT